MDFSVIRRNPRKQKKLVEPPGQVLDPVSRTQDSGSIEYTNGRTWKLNGRPYYGNHDYAPIGTPHEAVDYDNQMMPAPPRSDHYPGVPPLPQPLWMPPSDHHGPTGLLPPPYNHHHGPPGLPPPHHHNHHHGPPGLPPRLYNHNPSLHGPGHDQQLGLPLPDDRQRNPGPPWPRPPIYHYYPRQEGWWAISPDNPNGCSIM